MVEGKDDTTAIKRATGADTIETNGSAISDEVLRRIAHAQKSVASLSLRTLITLGVASSHYRRACSRVKHAFLAKANDCENGKGLESNMQAMQIFVKHYNVYTIADSQIEENITLEDLMIAKLIGHPQSKASAIS